MTRKVRKILFFIFFIIFILSAPSLILYYQGYRFDFQSKKLTQTGGLFLKVLPKQVEIYIDGKLIKKTDFFFGSALIENLLPKKYHIEVKKEGYFVWEKNLEIKEKEVIEAENIILFPKIPNFEILSKNANNFWPSPDGEKLILREANENGWSLKLFDLKRKVKSHLISERDFHSKIVDLLNLDWSQDSKEIYLDVGLEEQEKHFSFQVNQAPPVLIEKEIATSSENIISSKKVNGDIYYLDNFGHFFKNEVKLTEKPFPVEGETKYVLEIFGNFIFLEENQTLYAFNPDSKLFEKFFEKINNLKISLDNKKLVYFSDFEIWILFLGEKLDQPTKKAGQKLFLSRLSEKIKDVFWLNSDYLIFNAGDKIKINEIDDRDKINMFDLAEFKNPEIFFNQTDKNLYVLSEGNLFTSEKLIQ